MQNYFIHYLVYLKCILVDSVIMKMKMKMNCNNNIKSGVTSSHNTINQLKQGRMNCLFILFFFYFQNHLD